MLCAAMPRVAHGFVPGRSAREPAEHRTSPLVHYRGVHGQRAGGERASGSHAGARRKQMLNSSRVGSARARFLDFRSPPGMSGGSGLRHGSQCGRPMGFTRMRLGGQSPRRSHRGPGVSAPSTPLLLSLASPRAVRSLPRATLLTRHLNGGRPSSTGSLLPRCRAARPRPWKQQSIRSCNSRGPRWEGPEWRTVPGLTVASGEEHNTGGGNSI